MKNIYQELMKKLNKGERVVMLTTLSDQVEKTIRSDTNSLEEQKDIVKKAFWEGKPVVERKEKEWKIAEPFEKNARLIILGGGHISLALADFAARVGFSVAVVDDRPVYANCERFPQAEQVICDGFEHAILSLGITEKDYVVVLTRGHINDADCLRALAKCPTVKYLGMIGSRKRVAEQKDMLEEEGISRIWLESVYTPIGLDIGAVTPEEIAVAIIAEIIQVKRAGNAYKENTFCSDIEMSVIEHLSNIPESYASVRRAVATIIETRGSSPRKAGAKMAVYEDGSIIGTIGGGFAEAKITQIAGKMIRDGGYRIETVHMTNDVAASEGMACGGVMTVLIEVC